MSDSEFNKPQRQSGIGIVLIFATAVFQLVRNLWVLAVYFLVRDISPKVMFFSIVGLFIILILTLVYSVFSYLRFQFYINEKQGEFILEKGVFSSEVVSIPFHKIQQVNFKRNLLQRVLGIYSVAIDTAGSKEKEVEIKALSRSQAEKLGETLMELATYNKGVADEDIEEISLPHKPKDNGVLWEYKLNVTTLLKLGLTSNYFRGLAILLTFYFSLKEQFQFSGESDLLTEYPLREMLSTGFLILLLLLLGIFLTIGESFIKYYNLSLKRFPQGLQVEMGLRENTRVTVKAERIQLLQVLTNPLQRRLDLHKIKISLASSQDDLKRDRITIPGLPMKVVDKVREYLYENGVPESLEMRPHRLLLARQIYIGMLPILFGGIAYAMSSFSLGLEWEIFIIALYLLAMISFQIFYFRSLKLVLSENFLVKSSGVWILKKQILETFKLQAVTVSQPIWYKRRGIVNMTFHTAGGVVVYSFLDEAQARTLMNYLLYRIEATDKKWM